MVQQTALAACVCVCDCVYARASGSWSVASDELGTRAGALVSMAASAPRSLAGANFAPTRLESHQMTLILLFPRSLSLPASPFSV